DPTLFLNDWTIEFRLGRLNPAAAQACTDNKLLFHLYLRERFPEGVTAGLVGLVTDGQFVPLSGAGGSVPSVGLAEALAAAGFLIAKRISGNGGRSIQRVDRLPHDFGPGTYLIEPGIHQHDYAARI